MRFRDLLNIKSFSIVWQNQGVGKETALLSVLQQRLKTSLYVALAIRRFFKRITDVGYQHNIQFRQTLMHE